MSGAAALPPAGIDELLSNLQLGGNDSGICRFQRLERHAVFLGDLAKLSRLDDGVFGCHGRRTGGVTMTGGGTIGGSRPANLYRSPVNSCRRSACVLVSIVGVELSPRLDRLLAFAALDQHGREAGDAHGQHAKHGELQARTAFALLLKD